MSNHTSAGVVGPTLAWGGGIPFRSGIRLAGCYYLTGHFAGRVMANAPCTACPAMIAPAATANS